MHCHTTVLFTIVAVMNHPGVTHSYRLFAPVFFFNDPAPTEIYTLSLHDALPITAGRNASTSSSTAASGRSERSQTSSSTPRADRKSTRLNSSHLGISYAVFCLKKKKKTKTKQVNQKYHHKSRRSASSQMLV